MGTTTSYLSLLYGTTASSGGADLISTLYGYGPSGSTASGNPITALQSAETNQTKDIAITAAEPAVQRDVTAFRNAVTAAKDPSSLLSNPTVMKVLLTANGLSDQIQYTALAKKALLSDTSDSASLANKLTDTRWKTVAKTYNFATTGLSTLQNPKVLDTIANAYAEVTWRKSLDATTPGLSNALTFRAQASTVKSADDILGDPVLRKVVTTALGIPEQIAFQSLGAQEKAITNRLDITKLQDPHFVETFTQRYLLAAAASSTSTSTTPDITALAVQSAGLVV